MLRRLRPRSTLFAPAMACLLAAAGAAQHLVYTFLARALGEYLVQAVASAEDLDGDRLTDFLTGVPLGALGNVRTGVVEVRAGATGRLLYRLGGERGFDRFGASVAGVGDVDGDGTADLAASGGGTSSFGIVYVFSGKTGKQLDMITGSGGLGESVAGIPDVTRDGVPDLAVGIRNLTIGNSPVGGVRIYSGKDGFPFRTIAGRTRSGAFGQKVVSLGDYDRDKTPELAIYARLETSGASGSGAILVYQVDGIAPERTFTAGQPGALFGLSMAVLDDVKGDGRRDLVAGAPFDTIGGLPRSGSARVLSLLPLALTAPTRTASLLPAGFQILELHAGARNAGKRYLVLGSASGRTPPLRFGGLTIPLHLDPYLTATVTDPGAVVFNNLGMVGADGEARAAFRLPAGLPGALAGTVLHHAYVLLGPRGLELARNSVPVTLTLF